jgi:transposase InsO family protein
VRFAFIKQQSEKYPMKTLCQVLNVSRSGYYAWRKRPVSKRRERQTELFGQIKQAYEQSRRSYGSPRITAELKSCGVQICRNTVAKYMREGGVFVRPPRRFVPRTTDSDHAHPIAPNRIDRNFAATAPNQKWVCDLTYIWSGEGWLYLSIVMDLFSRKIVGWNMSYDTKTDGIAQAMSMAIKNRKPGSNLIHHSDRGCQYACAMYRKMLDKHRITASMSRAGNCYDNAPAESFFGTLKTELVHKARYRTRSEARSSVFEWIECWYNRRRRHSSLGYLSPESFEAQLN